MPRYENVAFGSLSLTKVATMIEGMTAVRNQMWCRFLCWKEGLSESQASPFFTRCGSKSKSPTPPLPGFAVAHLSCLSASRPRSLGVSIVS
ncbi:unnamed protein product [Linum trigynum]|uniref:Uncharacterized protein n=1 Tax=Linum trigynum TaxID=586398 RepID=A0AAV2EUN3_9ROSI